MLRKYYHLFFLFLAQILILGHGLVAHHHHLDVAKNDHHNTASRHHNNRKETPLEIAFSGINHAGEHVSFTSSSQTRIAASKADSKTLAALVVNFSASAGYLTSYQKNTYPGHGHIISEPPLNGAYTLRGPPFFSMA